jgi:hypothetical protein
LFNYGVLLSFFTKNNSMRRILTALLLVALGGAGYGYYLWNKPHQDMQSAKTDVTIEAATLFEAFNTNEEAANAQYLDKTIAVSGTVQSSTKTDEGVVKVTLATGQDFGVMCELDALTQHTRTDFAAGEKVAFKGLCSGLNLDVQLSRCVEIK